MRRLLWIGDAACDSGFARATHYTLETLRQTWEVKVLGLNYRGDPHPYPYEIYPAYVPGGDLFGVKRVVEVVSKTEPDVVVIQNDPWNIPRYIEKFSQLKVKPTLIGAIAVDGKNCRGRDLNGLDHVVFWTDFALREATEGGLVKPAGVVPLGVDLDIYKPGDRTAARTALQLPDFLKNGFIFLNVNRNQPRKRLDLTMRFFANFMHNGGVEDAYLFLHVCPTGDVGYDCVQLTKYYGLNKHVILSEPGVYQGATEQELVDTYRACNTVISTTQGEGWGLTTMEAMACGIPCIVPDWAALGEWASPGACMVSCTSTSMTPNRINVIGGVPDEAQMVAAMTQMYNSASLRNEYASKGLLLAGDQRYNWSNIGAKFLLEVETAYAATKDLGCPALL